MENKKTSTFTFKKRLMSMLKVDFKRMLISPIFYIMVGIALIIPILILVMTTMMDGSVSVNPQTGVETVSEGFDYVWQIIATPSNTSMTSMGLVSMCNINMFYFAVAVLTTIFISDDFKSGYCKNLFTTRSNKKEYVVSKTIVLCLCGALMLIGFFMGSLLGGAISNLSFDLNGVTVNNIIMCMITKIMLVLVFVPMYVVVSVVFKNKLWLSILTACGMSALLFMMVPAISPLDSTLINVILSLVGGILFSIGLGIVSNKILRKTSLV